MNLELLESFGQNYPEEFDGTLDCISRAVTCTFNRKGTLLAVGCNDGRVVIWDFLTRGIAKIISAHVHPVCSVSWSRDGGRLVSACTDNTVSVWDVLSGECEQRYRFPSPILKVQFCPRGRRAILVCPLKHAPVVVTIDEGHKVLPVDDDGDLNIIATYDRRGRYIYTGNAKGRVLVMNASDFKVVASFRVTSGASNTTALKTIEYARRGECFLINSVDRIIRVYDAKRVLAAGVDGEPEPAQKLQDQVNKTMWKKCCFSGDGEYVCAGSARQHDLYIWERSVGTLVKILQGTKGEQLLDVVWHPVRPIVTSISLGVVSVWAQNQVENWSAFAPDFKELDENVEYEERESEFDLSDEDRAVELHPARHDEVGEVDVSTVEPIQALRSSDEEGDGVGDLDYLPIAPEVEEPEEGWPHDAAPEQQENRRDSRDSPKKKRARVYDVTLADAPNDEVHPMLSSRPVKEKPAKKPGRQKTDAKRK
ncbi:retinoblastoma-binding protein 5 homolog [Pollicipes pollicipes]|uniref:retinoblastoma-binding protein 5 homolog n=1 Tax=Pollicipes pollicipes TaxID=41117 RepID=UPI0018852739|nr:retinoblastoma-binding protein 5 homolog [Pollicipes pollicipes]XP_037093924.1 retinoblastoma-binding protein 5 homolog [Pollicipes pollicipes]XP_037094033.1 retinoblastoma-binding protein 5 homolog [Pollicipes pollicipes]XP_037094034.1 retinoblastoma-binding protein 5 homolog [Pollicipes pollicipes]